MALQWQWSEKSGEIVIDGHEFNWYEGNALMICLDEFEENGQSMYNLAFFFCDKKHGEKCLGLAKDSDNMFTDYGQTVSKLTINKLHCRQWKKVESLFRRAFPEIEIIYEKEECTNGKVREVV